MPTIPDWVQHRLWELFAILLLLILIKLSLMILGSELSHFVKAIKVEIVDAAGRAKTVGAINFYGFSATALFGLVIIVASTGQKILGISFADVIGQKKADELLAYTNYQTMFFVLAVVLLVSLICVVIDNRRKEK